MGTKHNHAAALVVGRTEAFRAGALALPEQDGAHLVLVLQGALRLTSRDGRWIVPAGRLAALPARANLRVDAARAGTMCKLGRMDDLGLKIASPGVYDITRLLREVILRLCEPDNRGNLLAISHLGPVLVDEMARAVLLPAHLPAPKDPRALKLARHFDQRPAERRPLRLVAPLFGINLRTFERIFPVETGLSVGHWVQQFRLITALERLSTGMGVSDAAAHVGFENPSSFIALFRQHFGETPARFIARGLKG